MESLGALVGIAGVVVGGLLSMLSAAQLERFRENGEQRRLLAALFGELLNLHRHSRVSARELPDSASSSRHVLALRKSQYGSLAFFRENVSRLGFLRDSDIKELMQLSLKARNDDIHIAWAIEQITLPDAQVDLRDLKRRLENTASRALKLVDAIAARHPRFRRLVTSDDNEQ